MPWAGRCLSVSDALKSLSDLALVARQRIGNPDMADEHQRQTVTIALCEYIRGRLPLVGGDPVVTVAIEVSILREFLDEPERQDTAVDCTLTAFGVPSLWNLFLTVTRVIGICLVSVELYRESAPKAYFRRSGTYGPSTHSQLALKLLGVDYEPE